MKRIFLLLILIPVFCFGQGKVKLRSRTAGEGGSSGVSNANAGAFYRLLKPATQEIKTIAASSTILWDSTSNTNALTGNVDTTLIATKWYAETQGGGGNLFVQRDGSGLPIWYDNNDTLVIEDFGDGIFTKARKKTDSTFVSDLDTANSALKSYIQSVIQDAVQTLTNKRITPRIGTTASSATPTPDADAHDQYNVTALAANATFGAPTGTPTDGQMMLITIKDNGTSRTLAWNAIFDEGADMAFPTATVINEMMMVQIRWNAAVSKWQLIGRAGGF